MATANERIGGVLEPEQRIYPVQQRQTTEAAIHTTWFGDLYTVIGDQDAGDAWTVRLYHQPAGRRGSGSAVLMMVLGGRCHWPTGATASAHRRKSAPARRWRQGAA